MLIHSFLHTQSSTMRINYGEVSMNRKTTGPSAENIVSKSVTEKRDYYQYTKIHNKPLSCFRKYSELTSLFLSADTCTVSHRGEIIHTHIHSLKDVSWLCSLVHCDPKPSRLIKKNP